MQIYSSPDLLALSVLLRALLRRRSRIVWLEWLPVVTADAEQPGTWAGSFGALSPDEQCSLLDVLLRPDSGPLADVLLMALAGQAEQIDDEQVRQIVLHSVGAAWERVGRLEMAHLHVNSLSASVANLKERREEVFAVARETVRLETELAALRAEEFEVDDGFSRLHSLETQCRDLEWRQAALTTFDEAEAQNHVASLANEITRGEATRASLQTSLQALNEQLTQLNEQTLEMERQHTASRGMIAELTNQQNELQTSVAEAQGIVAHLRETITSTETRHVELQTTRQSLQTEADHLATQERDWNAQCERERSRLELLQRDADAARRADISAKIGEVFRLLPADRADEGFHAAPTSRR